MQPNQSNRIAMDYMAARDEAIQIYRNNVVALDKDVARLQTNDKYTLASYTAQRFRDNHLLLQIGTLILRELIAQKKARRKK